MKNPLHLFRSRKSPSEGVVSHSRGPSPATIVVSLILLIATFAGLAAGLQWLRSDEPKDDRPWEPHEALMTPVTADELVKTDTALDPDALASLAEPSTPSDPPPAVAEMLPAPREEEVPEKAEPEKAAATPKPITPRPAKPDRKVSTSTPKPVPPTRKRTPDSTAKAPGDRSAPRVLKNDVRESARSYQDTAEQQFPERETASYDERTDYFDHGPVDRRFIEADQRIYYRRLTRRKYVQVGPRQLVEIGPTGVVVRFRVNYTPSGRGEVANERMENRIRLRRMSPGLRIIAIQERPTVDEY